MRYFLMLTTLLAASIVQAGSVSPRAGWLVHETEYAYADLIPKVRSAVKQNGMFVVTQAGPTGAAKKRGITIPGNRVIGIYNNDFAVRAIRLSVPAMIEAPIRLYVTEDEGGTATLSYKMPSHVFAPYFDEGGPELRALAAELDAIFASIATDAIGE
ncbi:MAG: DUF302 domain-containing protein [Pseudomonadota bacterium]